LRRKEGREEERKGRKEKRKEGRKGKRKEGRKERKKKERNFVSFPSSLFPLPCEHTMRKPGLKHKKCPHGQVQ
jgi:hypothetical protein